jgi:hypothetical protein
MRTRAEQGQPLQGGLGNPKAAQLEEKKFFFGFPALPD